MAGRPRKQFTVSWALIGATSNLKDHNTYTNTLFVNQLGKSFFQSLKVGQSIEAMIDRKKKIGIIKSKTQNIITVSFEGEIKSFNLGDFITDDYKIRLV